MCHLYVDSGFILQTPHMHLACVHQDWIDIDFGIAEGVDFIAISFVKTPDVIKHLKSYIAARSPNR